MSSERNLESFTSFFTSVEPKLRHALIAAWGLEIGEDATADALTYAWEHWTKVEKMDNPAGYLYRVGRSSAKRYQRHPIGMDRPEAIPPRYEPSLDGALDLLTERQRAAVVLRHSFGWTHAEIGRFIGVSVPTVQKHIERGLTKLRTAMKVETDA
jgi:RNA polymerase sigma-70 factor (ECF subfamily)